MRRIELWIDLKEDEEQDVRREVKAALDSLKLQYTILYSSMEIGQKEERQK